jgi:L-amino acid N-acyltransferase YncA
MATETAAARVYAEGIATGNATFETEVPSWGVWDSTHLADHRFVALRDSDVVDWGPSVPSRIAASMAAASRTPSMLPSRPAARESGGACSNR